MNYLCNPAFKYIFALLLCYLNIKYVLRAKLLENNIRGISIITVIIFILLDFITINNCFDIKYEEKKIINKEVKEDENNNYEEKEEDIIVEDIKSIYSYNDTGVPIETYTKMINRV